jgi:serine acetyltransferase
MRRLALLLLIALPCRLRLFCYRQFFGWKIGRNVRIGWSVLHADHVEIGDDVRIGHLNLIRNVRRLVIGKGTYLLNSNHVFGSANYLTDFPAEVTIGAGAGIMSRHFIDASGTVVIGDGVILAGRDTHLWSHSATLEAGVRKLIPTRVEIGSGAYIGARATLVGCRVPTGAFVGAGAVVVKPFADDVGRVLLAGNPAKVVKTYAAAETPPVQAV